MLLNPKIECPCYNCILHPSCIYPCEDFKKAFPPNHDLYANFLKLCNGCKNCKVLNSATRFVMGVK